MCTGLGGSNGSRRLRLEGKKFVDIDSRDDYYLVNANGNLGVYDSDGLIRTAIRVR
jgi:hypothetical protein